MQLAIIRKILKYGLQFAGALFLLSLIVFYMARLSPGNPLRSFYGESVERMSVEAQEAATERLGLNAPIYVQYGKWLSGALQGKFGISFKYKRDVLSVVKDVYLNTILLGGGAFILTLLLALLLGAFCALHEDRLTDRIIGKIGTVTNTIPEFYISIVLILLFSVTWTIFPSGGAYQTGYKNSPADRIWHLILPVTVLTVSHLWYYAYMVRNLLVEETRKDYVLLCKSKGLGKKAILYKHCMKNIMAAFLSLAGTSVSHMLAGTYVVEAVFSYPGLGSMSFESAKYQDYNMLMVLCIITGAVVIAVNMAVQGLAGRMNPEMKSGQEGIFWR